MLSISVSSVRSSRGAKKRGRSVESEFIINLVECVEDTRTVNLCLFLEIAPLGDVMD